MFLVSGFDSFLILWKKSLRDIKVKNKLVFNRICIYGLIIIHYPNQHSCLPEPNIWRGLQPNAAHRNADGAFRHPKRDLLNSAMENYTTRVLPSVFYEGVVVSCVRLPTVDHNAHEFVVFWDCNFLPGGSSRGAVASSLDPVPAAVLPGHSGHGVGLHVQHPGELEGTHSSRASAAFTNSTLRHFEDHHEWNLRQRHFFSNCF